MERRAATRTRAERKMAAVREEAAMEGRSRARVTPRESRGRVAKCNICAQGIKQKTSTHIHIVSCLIYARFTSAMFVTFGNSEQGQGEHT